jgi:hypothetical protein
MQIVIACELPPSSLLIALRESGAFTDCYVTEINGAVAQAEFVEAFYTTRLFKLERFLLRWLALKPSTDTLAKELATGKRSDFAVWRVEQRSDDQLLLAEQSGRTKSWLMSELAASSQGLLITRLYFGSALVARTDRVTGEKRFGLLFTALLGFHRAYSRALLRAAALRLVQGVANARDDSSN